jgi:hypothetical protein
MHEHHRQTIENLRKHLEPDQNNLALIVIGSVARGEAGPPSDVDFYLVVPELVFDGLAARSATGIDASTCCVAPAGGCGGMAITKSRLQDLRERGNEFLRWSFTNAQIIFSRDAEIDVLVKEILVYPEAERLRWMESYHSQIYFHFSFFEFAYYSQTKYLIYQTATQMLLAAGRLILADNRRLYPGRKWFYRELERTPDKPEGFCDAMLAFLDAPTIEAGKYIIDLIENHKAYPIPAEGMQARILKESTLNLEE